MAWSLFKPFFSTSYYTYCEVVYLARLVEAEIVSPYRGILINTGVGNQTAPSIVVSRPVFRDINFPENGPCAHQPQDYC